MALKREWLCWVVVPLLLGVMVPRGQGFQCQQAGIFPDKDDCRSLFVCREGQLDSPRRESCDIGAHYDAEEEICKLGSDCARHAGPESLSFHCTEEGKYADPDDCHSYYHCCGPNTMSQRVTCFSGEGYFDPTLQVCMEGGCTNAPPPTMGPTDFTCTHSGFFPDPEDCRSYYRCDPDLSVHHGICYAGMGYFQPITGGCEPGPCSSSPVTPTPPTGAFQCMTAGVFRDPMDMHGCQGFIRCDADLHATRYECPTGEYFDVATSTCKTGPCPKKHTGGAGPQVLDDSVPTQVVAEEMTTIKDKLGFVYCSEIGVYPDPKSCRKYYRCNDFGVQTHGTCTIFGHYDATIQGCVFGMCFS